MSEKWHHCEIYIAIIDESQGRIAKNLKCDESLYYTFIVHSAGERSFKQGCSGAGTHGNAVPVNILARERRSHKCVSCKWERWCYSVPIKISNSRSFSFTYGHGCCVRRDSPTWNMQRVLEPTKPDPTKNEANSTDMQ